MIITIEMVAGGVATGAKQMRITVCDSSKITVGSVPVSGRRRGDFDLRKLCVGR
jgi:hypothetical protein